MSAPSSRSPSPLPAIHPPAMGDDQPVQPANAQKAVPSAAYLPSHPVPSVPSITITSTLSGEESESSRPAGSGAPVFSYLNRARRRRHVNAGGESCHSPLPSLFPLPPLFPAALAMARACGLRPLFRSPGGLQGPGSTAQGAGEAGAWPWPLLPLPRWLSRPCRSTGAGWGVLIRGPKGRRGWSERQGQAGQRGPGRAICARLFGRVWAV